MSEFCRQEIVTFYQLDISTILISPKGWEHLNDIQEPLNVPQENDFYFTIGSMAPHKNFEWVINTAKNNPKSQFLIAGGVDPKIWSYQANFSKTQNVRFLGYISDEKMKWYLYVH